MYDQAVSEILVFKTNIASDADIENIAGLLNADLRIRQWNIDVEDVDHVLRVAGDQLTPLMIVNMIEQTGFACEELPD